MVAAALFDSRQVPGFSPAPAMNMVLPSRGEMMR